MPDFHRFRLERRMKNVWGEHFDFKIEILEENFRLNSNKYSPAAWRNKYLKDNNIHERWEADSMRRKAKID
jgi:hypothetical protein